MRTTTSWPELLGPQCQHVQSGRCGVCAYPTLARKMRYVECVKTERGEAAAHEAMQRERPHHDYKGGRKARKIARAERMAELFIFFPRSISGMATLR